tara:strand:- start:434 stop:673 length:240 start_codon:yes stop_codon:yes gene_type:complete
MKRLIFVFFIIDVFNPAYSVTTKMFRVLDTCARYRLYEIDEYQAIEKLKLKNNNSDNLEAKSKVKRYCSVFTPNEKIEF